jgi:hypothetical protein
MAQKCRDRGSLLAQLCLALLAADRSRGQFPGLAGLALHPASGTGGVECASCACFPPYPGPYGEILGRHCAVKLLCQNDRTCLYAIGYPVSPPPLPLFYQASFLRNMASGMRPLFPSLARDVIPVPRQLFRTSTRCHS